VKLGRELAANLSISKWHRQFIRYDCATDNKGKGKGFNEIFFHFQEILQPVFYPTPSSTSAPPSNLTEEEQIKIAKRIGLIQHLPMGSYDEECQKKSRECVICMG
jgi:hypothetical protein